MYFWRQFPWFHAYCPYLCQHLIISYLNTCKMFLSEFPTSCSSPISSIIFSADKIIFKRKVWPLYVPALKFLWLHTWMNFNIRYSHLAPNFLSISNFKHPSLLISSTWETFPIASITQHDFWNDTLTKKKKPTYRNYSSEKPISILQDPNQISPYYVNSRKIKSCLLCAFTVFYSSVIFITSYLNCMFIYLVSVIYHMFFQGNDHDVLSVLFTVSIQWVLN